MATLLFCVLWYSLVALISQMNPIYILSPHFLMLSSHLSLGLPSGCNLHCFPTKIMSVSHLSYASYVSCLFQVMERPTVQPVSCHPLTLSSKLLPSTSDPKHLQSAIVPYKTTGPLSVSKNSGCPYLLNFFSGI